MARARIAFVLATISSAACPVPPGTSGDSCDISTSQKRRELASDAEVECSLSIDGTDLFNLDDFDGLRSVSSVWVNGNSRLTDMTGLSGLVSVPGSVVFRQHALLEEVLLDELTETNDISIDCMPSLSRLSLPSLASLQVLNLEESGPIVVEGFGEATQLARLEIWRTGITDLSFLADVTSIDTVIIKDNPALPLASINSLLAQLDPPPGSVEICGNGTPQSCSPEPINGEGDCLSSE